MKSITRMSDGAVDVGLPVLQDLDRAPSAGRGRPRPGTAAGRAAPRPATAPGSERIPPSATIATSRIDSSSVKLPGEMNPTRCAYSAPPSPARPADDGERGDLHARESMPHACAPSSEPWSARSARPGRERDDVGREHVHDDDDAPHEQVVRRRACALERARPAGTGSPESAVGAAGDRPSASVNAMSTISPKPSVAIAR